MSSYRAGPGTRADLRRRVGEIEAEHELLGPVRKWRKELIDVHHVRTMKWVQLPQEDDAAEELDEAADEPGRAAKETANIAQDAMDVGKEQPNTAAGPPQVPDGQQKQESDPTKNDALASPNSSDVAPPETSTHEPLQETPTGKEGVVNERDNPTTGSAEEAVDVRRKQNEELTKPKEAPGTTNVAKDRTVEESHEVNSQEQPLDAQPVVDQDQRNTENPSDSSANSNRGGEFIEAGMPDSAKESPPAAQIAKRTTADGGLVVDTDALSGQVSTDAAAGIIPGGTTSGRPPDEMSMDLDCAKPEEQKSHQTAAPKAQAVTEPETHERQNISEEGERVSLRRETTRIESLNANEIPSPTTAGVAVEPSIADSTEVLVGEPSVAATDVPSSFAVDMPPATVLDDTPGVNGGDADKSGGPLE